LEISQNNIGILPSVGSHGANNCEGIRVMFGEIGNWKVVDNATANDSVIKWF
jgi:hypothetical protein